LRCGNPVGFDPLPVFYRQTDKKIRKIFLDEKLI